MLHSGLLPFAVETCGYMGKEAVKFVNRLGDIAAESGHIPKGAFVRWAMQLLSVPSSIEVSLAGP